MANRLYREEAYLEKLELLLRTAKELAACRAQLEALDKRGVPEGSVIFSRPVKRYRRKNGEETVYRYTCEYLYIKGKKYYVSKKHRYRTGRGPGWMKTIRRILTTAGYWRHGWSCGRRFGGSCENGRSW